MKIPAPPSVNSGADYSIDVELPRAQWYRVDIAVAPPRRCGDVDNFIVPTLKALAKCGLKESRVAYISCRIGAENSVKVSPYDY